MRQGPLIIMSGPSGSGKSTLIERLLAAGTWPLRLSVSVTTRPPRPGEQDGKHYHFWTRARFDRELKAGGFLEWAEVHGNYYGTLKQEVEPFRALGQGVILDIDVNGWRQVKEQNSEALSLFVRTSSPEALEQRLRERGTETEEEIQRRLRRAEKELAEAHRYDFQVINDELDKAVADVCAIVSPLFERQNQNG